MPGTISHRAEYASLGGTLLKLPNGLPSDFNFAAMVQELKRTDIPWCRHYSEYQSGGWWTCSLLGPSADAQDGRVIDNAKPVATDALLKLPITKMLLEQLDLRYMMVRLARLDANGALWEHRDYQDLRPIPRQRIHLPIYTNESAFLVFDGRRFHMDLASLWTFRPTKAHGACNLGERNRVHLIIDAYEDVRLADLIAEAKPSSATSMPELSAEQLAVKIKHIRAVQSNNHFTTGGDPAVEALARWERDVLSLYFTFTVPEGELYFALQQACADDGDFERAAYWKARKELTLGEGIRE